MLYRLAPCSQVPSSTDIRRLRVGFPARFQEAFAGLVGYEEERCAGGRPYDGGSNARIDTAEAAGGVETAGGLQAGFQCVDGIKGEVDSDASDTSCLVNVKIVNIERLSINSAC